MKSNVFLATFYSILFLKIVCGQHNGLAYKENFESNNPLSQQQAIRKYAIVNNVQDFMKHNGNSASLPNVINQHQIMVQTDPPPPLPSTQQVQLSPDLQQQHLQVQQYLQLQKPLQQEQALPLQQALQLQPEIQIPLQTKQSLELQPQVNLQSILQSQRPIPIETQGPFLPTFSQDILQVQPQIQAHTSQPLQLQPQQILQSQDSLQAPQSLQYQDPISFQQYFTQKPLLISESKNLEDTLVTKHINKNQPSSQIHVKWKSSNPQTEVNTDIPQNIQNFYKQPFQQLSTPSVQDISNVHTSSQTSQDVPVLKYYVASPQSSSIPVPSVSTPVVANCHSLASIPSNYMKPAEETYVPVITPYNYAIPASEVQFSVPEIIQTVNSVSPPPLILTASIPPNQNTNIQSHYYNQQVADRQNEYISQNSWFRYPEQSYLPVTIHSQPTVSVPSQTAIISSIPPPIIQAPSISPQYGVSTGFPVTTFMAPVYTSNRSKSSNLKSILPILFKLLKDKIASCSCKNECPCQCKNNNRDNELDVASGYSSQKDYGTINNDVLSILNTVSEETEGPEYIREPKNCEKFKEVSSEVSRESLEEDCVEEENYEDEED